MITKMERENRAKQFMPFSALKGYPEELEKKERVLMPQAEFCEEYQEELDRKLRQIQRGDVIGVTFYRNNAYHNLTGTVEKVDAMARVLLIEGTKIPFDRLSNIQTDLTDADEMTAMK